jgi:hypothetical protein
MRPFVWTVAPPRPPRHCASRQQAALAPMSAKYRSLVSTGTTRALSPSVKGPSPSTIAETSRPRSPEREQGQSIPRARSRRRSQPASGQRPPAGRRSWSALDRPVRDTLHRPVVRFSTKPLMSLPDGAAVDPRLDLVLLYSARLRNQQAFALEICGHPFAAD